MSEQKQDGPIHKATEQDAPVRKVPAIPPREPKGEAEWSVTVRHSPLKIKRGVVKANGKSQAWQRFLDQADARTTPEAFKAEARDGRKAHARAYQQARAWIAEARKEQPMGVEIIGAEYVKARMQALRVKGTVSIEQIGFPELASV